MKTQFRRRIACLTAGLAALALLVGPCVSWALDASGVTGTDTGVSQVTTAADSTSSTVQTAAPTVDATVQSTVDTTVQTTQTAVEQTAGSVQTAVQSGTTAAAVPPTTTRVSRRSGTSAGGASTTTARRAATQTATAVASTRAARVQRDSTTRPEARAHATRRQSSGCAPSALSLLDLLLGTREATCAGTGSAASAPTLSGLAFDAALPICDPGSLGALLDPIEPVVAMICSTTRTDFGSPADPSPGTPLVIDPPQRIGGARAARTLPHALRGAASRRPGGGSALFAIAGSPGRGGLPLGGRRAFGARGRGAFAPTGRILYAHPAGSDPAPAHHAGGDHAKSHFPLAFLGGAGFNATDLLMLLFGACWVAVAAVMIRRGSARILARAR